uniref:Acyltransferase C-terminal domain-containing protein n=1 Tax=Sinocyclocheilus anshuiensis TaxID=1608454 RepID=A0A671PN87_9TELE
MATVTVWGLCFLLTLFLGSFFGSIFMLGPVLPLMLLSPAWYRWVTDRIVATWLTLPVVRYLYTVVSFICTALSTILIVSEQPYREDRAHMANMLQYFCHIKEPLQLLLFPEGTDLTGERHGHSAFDKMLGLGPSNNKKQNHLEIKIICFHVRRFSAACLPSSAEQLQRWCQERWREKEHRLCAFYRSEPRRFDQPEARVPPCKSQLRVALIKAASLLYWSAFITLCCQRVTGGVELMELACHRCTDITAD